MGNHSLSVKKQETETGSDTQRQRSAFVLLIPVIGFLVALSLLLYPVVATYVNNANQQRAAQRYDELEQQQAPEQLAEALQSAHRYNETRARGPILDPWLSRVEPDNVDYQAYLAELNDLDTMGRLIVPAMGVDLPIYHGTEESVLHRGVGHLFGSDLPVGGPGTHSVLTAHTGLSTATLFDKLIDVREGDGIYVQVAGEKLKYEVDHIEVVLPNESESLKQRFGQDRITLITCTPYGQNTHRLLVHGKRVPLTDAAVFEETHGSWPKWMIGFVIAAMIGAVLVLMWLGRQLRIRRAAANAEPKLTATTFIALVVVIGVATTAVQFTAPPKATAADDNDNFYVTALAQARTLGIGISPDDKTYNDAITVGAATQERHKVTPEGQWLEAGPNLLSFGDNEVINLNNVGGLGSGLPIPLLKTDDKPGLLSLGSYGTGKPGAVGVAGAHASTNSKYQAMASAGLVGDDGSINVHLNDNTDSYEPVEVDVTALLKQLQLAALTDKLIDKVSITAGVGGSNAELRVNPKTGLQELDSDYAVADVKLNISAPVLKGVSRFLTEEKGLPNLLNEALGKTLNKDKPTDKLLNINLKLPLSSDGPIAKFLREPILNDRFNYTWTEAGVQHTQTVPEGLVSIDLHNGLITVDLEKLHAGDGADGTKGLNGLPPNTKLLSAKEVNLILGAVLRLLAPTKADGTPQKGSLLAKIDTLLTGVLDETGLEINLLGGDKFSTLRVRTTVGALVGGECAKFIPDKNRCDIKLLGLSLGPLVGTLLLPVTELLKLILDKGLGNLLGQVLNPLIVEVLQPLIRVLQPLLNGLNHVATITVNRQWTKPVGPGSNFGPGTLHSSTEQVSNTSANTYAGEAFSVAALEIGLFNWNKDQSNSALAVTLAESTVRTQVAPIGTMRCASVDGTPTITMEMPVAPPTGRKALNYPTQYRYRGVRIPANRVTESPVQLPSSEPGRIELQGTRPDAISRATFPMPTMPVNGWPTLDGQPLSTVTKSRTVVANQPLPPTTTAFAREVPLHQSLADDPLEYGSRFVFDSDTATPLALAPQASQAGAVYSAIATDVVKKFIAFAFDDKGYSTEFAEVLAAQGDQSQALAVLKKYAEFNPAGTMPGLDTPQLQIQFMERLATELTDRLTKSELEAGKWRDTLLAKFAAAEVDKYTGEVTATGLAVGETALVPVLRVSEDCGVSLAVARLDVISELGDMPLTGGLGIHRFGWLAGIIAMLSVLFMFRFDQGRREGKAC